MKKSLLTLIFGFITILSHSQVKDSFIVSKGDHAYNFVGMDEKGNEIQLNDFKGENRIQDKYSDRLKVISFHEDNLKTQWENIAERKGIKFNCTSIWTADNKKEISKVYQIDGWPYFFLINKEGVIVTKWFGNDEDKLNRRIKKYLK